MSHTDGGNHTRKRVDAGEAHATPTLTGGVTRCHIRMVVATRVSVWMREPDPMSHTDGGSHTRERVDAEEAHATPTLTGGATPARSVPRWEADV